MPYWYRVGMPHRPVPTSQRDFARGLRRRQTEEERRLWWALGNHFAVRFRRQVPIGPYIVDFAAFRPKLVIEVDGIQHLDNPSDRIRDARLRRWGFGVERFWNGEVLHELDMVLDTIESAIEGLR